jgi:hypothetical protein
VRAASRGLLLGCCWGCQPAALCPARWSRHRRLARHHCLLPCTKQPWVVAPLGSALLGGTGGIAFLWAVQMIRVLHCCDAAVHAWGGACPGGGQVVQSAPHHPLPL